jgi:peptidoglycan/LPS O-acetylase OafA/YrhL
MKSFYLPGLNGLRAIACMMVFYSHFNLNIGKLYGFRFHDIELGSFGVTCFFTLSGFLITTLLLQEKKDTDRINFRNFYVRRILRIWPLYFLVLLIGVIYFINAHFET